MSTVPKSQKRVRIAMVLSVGRFRRIDTTEMRIREMMPIYDTVGGMARCLPTANPRR